MDHGGDGNDGVGQTSQMDIMPGETKTYVIKPRVAGTMYYHCHVQPHTHIPMGLAGMFIVEENRPNNWPQVFNIGAGQVRHPSAAVLEKYTQEYDLHYQSVDKELHALPQSANDPRLIAKAMNQEYDITDAKDDYFLLNGRAFPYTLRESIVAVKPNQKVKIRVLNGHTEHMALHIHGHKATETHYDGIEQNPAAQVTRDVYSLAPAQRLDLSLDTTDDGLHSYGAGLWMFHDHVEKAFTTNGMGEGGSISLVAYDNYIDANGTPKSHGMDLKPYFTKEYWERKIPVWQDLMDEWGSLGAPKGTMDLNPAPAKAAAAAPATTASTSSAATGGSPTGPGLLSGLLLGIAGYLGYLNRDRLLALIGHGPSKT
jgi:FtsP/CotA-like multicopper oxidase with cupredoxin domain